MPPQVRDGNVTVYEDTSWERMWASETSRLLTAVRPWLVLPLLLLAGWGAHQAWGRMPAVPWAAAALSAGAVVLALFAYAVSRLAPVGRAHTAVTVFVAVSWLAVAVITGPVQQVTGGALGICGAMLALSWNLRASARRGQAAHGQAPHGAGDRLAAWFKDAAAEGGMAGAELRSVVPGAARATATAQLPAGKTASDLISRVPAIESAAGMPPGAITATADPDRADWAGVVLSDPRVLTRPIPWPGPSAAGASIAAPLSPGIYQDGEPVAFVIVGQSIFMMGASGAGKTMGGMWNLLGEAMTRPDTCILATDITKGAQSFGPLLPGLHRFERDKAGARSLIGDVHSVIRPRTDYLADRGLQAWQEGCGLSYLIVWHEETGDTWDALGAKGEDQFISTARAIRSAGGMLVCSIQRNTFDQLPTIVRAQMASMCFGLNDPQDCRFGLSTAQQNAGVDPSEWGIRFPGKAVLDAASVPADRITMPLRTYSWGQGEEASAAMLAHATAYPATARPADPITAQICASSPAPVTPAVVQARPSVTLAAVPDGREVQADDDGDDLGDPVADYLGSADDPSPDITADAAAADLDAPLAGEEGDAPFDFEPGEKLPPDEARTVFAAQLAAWRESGVTSFAPKDLRPVQAKTGMGRGWIQARLREALDSGEIERGEAGCYGFPDDLSRGGVTPAVTDDDTPGDLGTAPA